MPKPLTAVIVTNDDSMAERISQLANRSAIAVLGHTAYTPRGLRKILKKPPNLILCDGAAGEGCYIPYARHISDQGTRALVVLLSSQTDVALLARAAVAGVAAVIPPLLPQAPLLEALRQVARGGTPNEGKAFQRIRERLGLTGGIPGQAITTVHRSDPRECAERCLQLGLSEDETADFLGVDAVEVARLASSARVYQASQTHSSTSAIVVIRCLIVVAISLAIGVLASSRSVPSLGPFRGRVAYEDSTPIPAGPLRVEFRPMSGTAMNDAVAHAITDHATGVFNSVNIHNGDILSLPRGRYRVTVLQGDGGAVPSSIIPEEYGDPSRTPLVCNSAKGLTLLQIRRPAPTAMLTPADNASTAVKQEAGE